MQFVFQHTVHTAKTIYALAFLSNIWLLSLQNCWLEFSDSFVLSSVTVPSLSFFYPKKYIFMETANQAELFFTA